MSRWQWAPVISAAVVTGAVTIGCGVAQAGSPSVVGDKYSDAKGTLSGAGFSPVVSTTVGDQLPWDECVVVRQQDRSESPPENSGGSTVSQTLISLNCDDAVATAGAPGNSAASPEGVAALKAAQQSASQSQALAATNQNTSGGKH